MKKCIRIIINCFIVFISVVLLLLLFVSFSSKNDGLAKLGHYSFFNVEGDSMYPEIKNGDFIAIDRNVKDKYEPGDIISFLYEVGDGYIIVTHEVIEVEESGNQYRYVTKGINNDENDEKKVLSNEIIGEYIDFRIPLLGYVVGFSRTNLGYLLLIVMPLGVVLLLSIYELLKELGKVKKGEV